MTPAMRRLLAGAAALAFAAAAWAQPQRGTVDVIPPWAIPGKATEPAAPAATPAPKPGEARTPPAPSAPASPRPDTPRTAPDPSADAAAVPAVARVSDGAGLLSGAQRQALEAKLEAFERARGSQVVVLTVPTLGFETIEEYAGRVTDSWKLGRKGIDDGVLFVIAVQDRKLRIHTGRGVQGTLTDALSKRIVSDIVTPRFRTGDFAGGIDAGVDAIFKAIEGENLALPAPKSSPQGGGGLSGLGSIPTLLIIAFFVIPVVGSILRSIFGRFFGAAATAGLAGVGGTILLGSLFIGIIAAVVAFLFTLLGGMGVGRAVGRGGRGPVFIPGGFGGGGGGWGGGGGGFSGGGGGFDGGGASGSW
jgi:uncharacterized protein